MFIKSGNLAINYTKSVCLFSSAFKLLKIKKMTMKYFFILLLLAPRITFSQEAKERKNKIFIDKLINDNQYIINNYLNKKSNLKIQTLFTKISHNAKGKAKFEDNSYNNDKTNYFYPASTVKMPIAFLALEKLNDLNIPSLNMHTTMITDSGADKQTHIYTDPTSKDGRPTIANYIKQIFLVSDNEAYNRLYEFLGQEYIQYKLKEKGYPNAIIRHRLETSMADEQQRITNPIYFYDSLGKLIYSQPAQISKVSFNSDSVKMGKGFIRNGKLINEPFDFTNKNRLHLEDLHNILKSVLFSESINKKHLFNLKKEDYNFLFRWMSSYPSESKYPSYDSTSTWNNYVKFLWYGADRSIPINSSIRIFNKVGDAYGFLIDVSYFADFQNNIEFMLSAVIYCNEDGIFNDNKYEYETIGLPFLKELGQAVHRRLLKKPKNKNIIPKKFVMAYHRE